jgi:hypothetical protein
MNYELYIEIALAKNIRGTKYKKNDLATIVEILSTETPIKYELEFYSTIGEPLGKAVVTEEYIKPLSKTSIVSMREL